MQPQQQQETGSLCFKQEAFLRMAVTLAALNAALKPALLLLWLLFSLHP